jgi:RNA ligase (TIGR02306 family)
MAELKAEVIKIGDVLDHPNADRMELVMVGGYQVCVQKGAFNPGDDAVYIPVDSVLPEKLEAMIFGPDAKVKLKNHRVRAIKLRGAVSQGMLVPQDVVVQYIAASSNLAKTVYFTEGADMTSLLGITKYQPPIKHVPGQMNVQRATKRHHHPDFHKYTSINNVKKYWEAIPQGAVIWNTEKLHGTNFRAGWVPFVPRTFLQKLKKFFSVFERWEFVYGSHNVQLMDGKKNAAHGNVYKRIVEQENLREVIPEGQVWYGEIIGDGIQKNYSYGMVDCVEVRFMDVMDSVTGEYMNFVDAAAEVENQGQMMVPYECTEFYHGWLLKLLEANPLPSEIDGVTQVEGFVIRPMYETKFYGGRLILKAITDAYLLKKDNTDWH